MSKRLLCSETSICQKCGDDGFRQVMIVCRQCRKSCEHKYCLFKFPKIGEKVRWYCEGCRPTIFLASSLKELEVDTERSNVNQECGQTLSSISQIENAEGKAVCVKSPSAYLDENRSPRKEIRLTFGETVHEVHKNNSHQEIVVYSPVSLLEKLRVDSERSKNDLICNQIIQIQEASQGVSSTAQIEKGYIDENVQNTPLTRSVPRPPATCGENGRRNNSFQATVVHAVPIVNCVWRGRISFGGDEFVPFRAHGSSTACQRVFDAAKLLPPVISMSKHLTSEISETLFKDAPPTYESIGLYIFPDTCARPKFVVHSIDDIIKEDLMFVYKLDEVEMLVFSSYILPEGRQRFRGEHYLWCTFRTTAPVSDVGKENSESDKMGAKGEKKHGENKKRGREEDGNQESLEEEVPKKQKIGVSHKKQKPGKESL